MGVPGVPGVVTEGSTVDKPGSSILDQKGHTRYPHRASPCGHGRRVINRGFPIVSGPAHSHSYPATCICLLPHLHLHLSDGDRCAREHGAVDMYCVTVRLPRLHAHWRCPDVVGFFSWVAPLCPGALAPSTCSQHVKRVKRLWRGMPALCPPPSLGLHGDKVHCGSHY